MKCKWSDWEFGFHESRCGCGWEWGGGVAHFNLVFPSNVQRTIHSHTKVGRGKKRKVIIATTTVHHLFCSVLFLDASRRGFHLVRQNLSRAPSCSARYVQNRTRTTSDKWQVCERARANRAYNITNGEVTEINRDHTISCESSHSLLATSQLADLMRH